MEKINFLKEEDLEIFFSEGIRKVLFIGGSDTGKTTLIKDIANFLFEKGEKVFIFDCDIGQSHIGPPTTIGYAEIKEKIEDFYLEPEKFYFVGSVAPSFSIIEFITGITKVNYYLNNKKGKVLIDTTGYIKDKVAISLKIHKIEIIKPDFVVLLEKENELGEIKFFLNSTNIKYKKIKVENLPTKSMDERANYRKKLFSKYFTNLKIINLNLNEISIKILNFKNVGDLEHYLKMNLKGYICSLRNQFLEDFSLGIINKNEGEKVEILIPEKNLYKEKIKGITISNFFSEDGPPKL
ncbi:MAG: hypothetical protein NC833_04380 [Candidatus Omnitrophica bacterium]|nr:hypothetical protein [Candidatus Omnitrophota bacterium]